MGGFDWMTLHILCKCTLACSFSLLRVRAVSHSRSSLALLLSLCSNASANSLSVWQRERKSTRGYSCLECGVSFNQIYLQGYKHTHNKNAQRTHTHAHAHTHKRTHTHTLTHSNTLACSHTHKYTHMHTHSHTYTHSYINIHEYTYIYRNIHTYEYTYIYRSSTK